MTADPLVPLNTQDIVALLSLFEKACKDLSRREGSDAIIKKLGLPDKIEQGGSDGVAWVNLNRKLCDLSPLW